VRRPLLVYLPRGDFGCEGRWAISTKTAGSGSAFIIRLYCTYRHLTVERIRGLLSARKWGLMNERSGRESNPNPVKVNICASSIPPHIKVLTTV